MLRLCNPQRLRTCRHLFSEKITGALKQWLVTKNRKKEQGEKTTEDKRRRMKEMHPSQKEDEKSSPGC